MVGIPTFSQYKTKALGSLSRPFTPLVHFIEMEQVEPWISQAHLAEASSGVEISYVEQAPQGAVAGALAPKSLLVHDYSQMTYSMRHLTSLLCTKGFRVEPGAARRPREDMTSRPWPRTSTCCS